MTKKRDRKKPESSQPSVDTSRIPWLLIFQVEVVVLAKGPQDAHTRLERVLDNEKLQKVAGDGGIAQWNWKLLGIATPKKKSHLVTPPSGLVGPDGKPLKH